MVCFRLTKYAMISTGIAYWMILLPNTSYPIKIGASKVLVAVPNTAQYPRAATSSVGRPSNPAKTAPELAPIAKSGVTSPP